jgi:hypothetical protein
MMKPWHEVATPHPDIRAGRFDESVFAADLADVLADRGPLEYRDADTFFRKTYPTQGLVNLLSAVASRLSGRGKGPAVIQIQTPFGGGKTHSLIALYHLFKNPQRPAAASELISKVLEHAQLDELPVARVATFTGTAADPLTQKTPWGEIADQLGKYALLAEHDQKRRAPGKNLLHQLLAGSPTLLLMDEVAEYAAKAKDFREQVNAFFQELTETVKVLPQCALVVTLPSSAPYGEEGERALYQLGQIFGRMEAIYVPVEGEEIYEIIRRRLFENSPDPVEVRKVADSYWEMYRRLGDDLPHDVRETSYRDKLRKAYPFHPELIDLLLERWSTFPSFQRTRGVLRLLAEIVADLYRRDHSAPLIQPAHVNLNNPVIRSELLKHIGNQYEGVITADIAGGNAKAQRIDREIGSEYDRFNVASGLATAIFFASFSGSEKKGVSVQRLRLALLREGIPPAVVGDALRRLEEELWYLHVEGGFYSFSSQPNLNRILVEKEEAVGDELITEEIRTRLEKLAGSDLRVTLWPKASQDVPDTKELKLAILSPEHSKQSSTTQDFVDELLKKTGSTFRTYQNTLLVLAADNDEFSSLRQKVKRWLALRAIRDDKKLNRQLSEDNRKTLDSKWRDLDSAIPFSLLSAYRHLAKPGENGAEWCDLGLPTTGAKESLASRVREFLRSQDYLLEHLSPAHLLKKAVRPEEHEKPVSEIVEAFLRYPQLPMIQSPEVIEQALNRGAQEGIFAVRIGDRVYFQESPPASILGTDAVLVRKERVDPPPADRKPGPSPSPDTIAVGPQPSGTPSVRTPSPVDGDRRRLTLRVRVPWDKLSDFVRGVIMPLRNDGAELQVEVLVQAQATSGSIKPATLEHKVKETIRQIHAEILEETYE